MKGVQELNRLILDVEAIPTKHIYDIGYVIVDKDFNIKAQKHFIIKQIYDNSLSYETAYYKEKRPLYVSLLKGRKAKRTYLGHAMRSLKADIAKYDIKEWYAFNSDYDKSALAITCEWFKIENPLKDIQEYDIRKIAMPIYEAKEYQTMCNENGFITPKGYIKTTAETTYAYLIKEPKFKEVHMGLHDAIIEAEILQNAFALGGSKLENRTPFIKAVA